MTREDALVSALAQLEAACGRLRRGKGRPEAFASPDTLDAAAETPTEVAEHARIGPRTRGGVRLAQELSEEESVAVEAWACKRRHQRKFKQVDATVAEAISTEWHGTDADEVEVLVARFKQLRARRAGLELREKEQRGEPGASDAASIASGSQNAETLRHELAIARTKLGDANKADENLEASRTRINALRTKLDDIDGHIRDLRAVASATARVSSSSRPSDSSNSAFDETDQEAATAAAACDDFARKAAEFEAAKRTAVHSSANVRSLWEKVNDMRSRLETLQEEARVKQLVEAALRENMKQAVKAAGIPSTGGSVSSETSTPESHGTAAWQARAMATSLALLVDQGGEMLLNDWKRAIAKALDLSSAKVIQFVYGLVANSLVSIDRAQKEARVIAHIA